MAIDYSLFLHKKPRVKSLEADDRRNTVADTDKKENAKAKARSGGRCEVRTLTSDDTGYVLRCIRSDTQTHHLLGGIGRRNRGKSILALYKLRTCSKCHEDITGKKLQPTTAEHTALTVLYRRDR